MRWFFFGAMVFLTGCNIMGIKENPQSVYDKLMHQRWEYLMDGNELRLDTVYLLVEQLRESGDDDWKRKGEYLKVAALFASCNFKQLKEFMSIVDVRSLDYELQKNVYRHYCNAKLASDSMSLQNWLLKRLNH